MLLRVEYVSMLLQNPHLSIEVKTNSPQMHSKFLYKTENGNRFNEKHDICYFDKKLCHLHYPMHHSIHEL